MLKLLVDWWAAVAVDDIMFHGRTSSRRLHWLVNRRCVGECDLIESWDISCFITDFTNETNWSRFCHWTLPACWSDGVSVHQSSRDGNEISFMCVFIQLVIIYCSLNEVTVLVPEERFWFLRSSSGLSYSDSSDIKFIKLSPVLVKTSRLLMSRLDLY